MQDTPVYGMTRQRQAKVTYAEIERAALDVLAEGRRPSVEIVRKLLGRGSPATIGRALNRFWRDLGVRAAGDPAALTRMPADIVDLADGLWQRALALASQAANNDDNAARERLAQLQMENEIRAQSFSMREKEFDAATREREMALSETREQTNLLMRELASDRATMRAQATRITELSSQVEAYRLQLSKIVTRAVAQHQTVRQRKLPATPDSNTRKRTAPRLRSKKTTPVKPPSSTARRKLKM
jgi:hypothetical protein